MKIIDCDVHQTWADAEELIKRLPEGMRRGKFSLPGNSHPSPVGVLRADAKPQERPPGSCPDFMIRHHLEPFGIRKAVLTGSGVLKVGVHPNVHYAAAMARAYNDALIETWLEADPRFAGSILVTPQDPQAAARLWARALMRISTRAVAR